MICVVTQLAREGVLCELLYADVLVMMSETIDGLRNKFIKWMAFVSNGLKVNLGKTNVMASAGITNDGLSKIKVDSCGVCCCLSVKVNSFVCVQCGKWIHGQCAGVKMVITTFSRNLACRKQ